MCVCVCVRAKGIISRQFHESREKTVGRIMPATEVVPSDPNIIGESRPSRHLPTPAIVTGAPPTPGRRRTCPEPRGTALTTLRDESRFRVTAHVKKKLRYDGLRETEEGDGVRKPPPLALEGDYRSTHTHTLTHTHTHTWPPPSRPSSRPSLL